MTQPTAPFADIEAVLTDTTMSMLANVTVTPAVGEPFPALFALDTTEFFDSARGADYTLRYASTHALSRGDTLTVAGSPLVGPAVVLKVSEKPTALRAGHESVAPLVKAS